MRVRLQARAPQRASQLCLPPRRRRRRATGGLTPPSAAVRHSQPPPGPCELLLVRSGAVPRRSCSSSLRRTPLRQLPGAAPRAGVPVLLLVADAIWPPPAAPPVSARRHASLCRGARLARGERGRSPRPLGTAQLLPQGVRVAVPACERRGAEAGEGCSRDTGCAKGSSSRVGRRRGAARPRRRCGIGGSRRLAAERRGRALRLRLAAPTPFSEPRRAATSRRWPVVSHTAGPSRPQLHPRWTRGERA